MNLGQFRGEAVTWLLESGHKLGHKLRCRYKVTVPAKGWGQYELFYLLVFVTLLVSLAVDVEFVLLLSHVNFSDFLTLVIKDEVL